MLVKLAGIDTTSYKLSEVKGVLNQKEMNRIFKKGKIASQIYARFLDGVLVIFCSSRSRAHLHNAVLAMKEKAKKQKKKQLFQVTLFEYAH